MQDLEYADFEKIVVADIKGEVEEEALRDPENVGRWHAILLDLRDNMLAELANEEQKSLAYHQMCLKKGPRGKREWFEYKGEWKHWEARAKTFLAHINNRIREARELIDPGDVVTYLDKVEDELEIERNRNKYLAMMIRRHAEGEIDDERLWQIVSNNDEDDDT